MKKVICLANLFLFVFVFQAKTQTDTKIFSGTIGESRVQMILQRNGGELSGTYFYKKVGKDLTVSGTIDGAGKFNLTEKSLTEAKTGEFTGLWSKDEEIDSIVLNGTWTNPQATKTLDFFLNEQKIFFTNGARLTPKVFTEKNKPKFFEINAEYPELSGVSLQTAAKFNQIAKTLAMNEAVRFRKKLLAQTVEDLELFKETGGINTVEINYNVEYADNEIISIFFSNYFYMGGAHESSYSFTLNFDLKTGRQLKLADLFKPNSNYLKVISDYSIQKLKKDFGEDAQDDWLQLGAGAELKNFKSWNITKKGLNLNFDTYQVASYVAGPQEVIIPFEEMKNILRNDFSVLK